ncbi:class I SAM-dependent methyltransferase [Saccharothrix sp.]|uniref:class I SAM-dependent methyltransferase n=1 Tax=Saccharothrix sp. TaxID=1873460 RepID=UPI002811A967|nr:class I SAM-dependent methyltransferase [Saccharothrix sp.]
MSAAFEEPVRCLLCRQRVGAEPVFGGRLRRCVACGFTWTVQAPVPGPTAADLYDETYFREGGYRNYFEEHAQRRHEARLRLRWLWSVVRPRSVVEAGSAGGFFLEQAQRAGIRVEGVEPSGVCVGFARDRLGVSVRQGTFETYSAGFAVDAVCAFHVLEHVEDPHGFLAAARRALVPGGWLALEVPNIASVGARRHGVSWHGLQPDFHRWHFSPESLRRLVHDHGFHIRHCDTVSVSYYLRPRYWLSPRGSLMLLKEWAADGNPLMADPERFDLLRLLARLPRYRRRRESSRHD